MFSLDTFVDKTYVLHLDFRNDREIHFKNELKKININNYKVISGYSPMSKDIPYEYLYCLKNKNINILHGYNCVLFGHLDIIKDAKLNGYKKILILEDDVFFKENFNEVLEKIIESQLNIIQWDALWVGINATPITNEQKIINKVSENLIKINFFACGAFCYILNINTFDFILRNTLPSISNPLYSMDSFYFKYFIKKYHCYYVSPNIANTILGFSDSSGFTFSEDSFEQAFNY